MKRAYLNTFVFSLTLIGVGFLNMLFSGPALLADINLKSVTMTEITSGQLFRQIEESYSDNFVFKNRLMEIASALEELKGVSTKLKIVDTKGINVAGDWKNETGVEEELVEGTNFGSILIVDDKAMEININNPQAREAYAQVLNTAAEVLGDQVKVFSMLIPTQIEFVKSDEYRDISYSQREAIADVYNRYKKVIGVDVYDVLQEHADEYIYFRTDHHWTQLGAYYAYTEFIKKFDENPVELTDFSHFIIEDFLGSLYRVTNSNKLITYKDIIDVYVPKAKSVLYNSADKKGKKGNIIEKSYEKEQQNKYGVFLGGDRPIIYIESELDNDNSILVIKDSYAKAFIPFLTNHFRHLYVIDPRLWEGNLSDLVKGKGINNILFINYCLINRYQSYAELLSKML